MQKLEGIALKRDAPAIVQGLGGARDLSGIKLLMPVRRECRIHICYECCDRQCIHGSIRRAEQICDRVACET
jgi:hypothetical protein